MGHPVSRAAVPCFGPETAADAAGKPTCKPVGILSETQRSLRLQDRRTRPQPRAHAGGPEPRRVPGGLGARFGSRDAGWAVRMKRGEVPSPPPLETSDLGVHSQWQCVRAGGGGGAPARGGCSPSPREPATDCHRPGGSHRAPHRCSRVSPGSGHPCIMPAGLGTCLTLHETFGFHGLVICFPSDA